MDVLKAHSKETPFLRKPHCRLIKILCSGKTDWTEE